MAGYLDQLMNPQSQGILNLAAGMLQASGPSRMPVSFGQVLGQGVQQGTNAYQQALQMQMQQAELARRANAPINMGAGGVLLDPMTRQPIFQAPFAPRAEAEPKAPTTRKLRIGEEEVTQEFDPVTKTWKEVGRGKAFSGTPLVQVNPLQDNLGLKPKDRFDMEDKLRGDFQAHPTVKAADEMRSAFNLIETAYQRPSAANDLAMATKYMKILDPTSVVRESEFALAVNATGLLDKVQNYSASILEGKKLNPTQRKDFYDSAKAINEAFQKEREGISTRFKDNATQYNLNPENVIGSPRKVAEPKTMGTMPLASKHKGKTIEDSTGKRYKSDGMKWQPVK